ncbi:MAG TPA: hypothetical protein VF755_28350, partial [Catenuloplanes sp.]
VAAAFGVLGFVAGLISLVVPWAVYRVRVEVPGGEGLDQSGGIAVFQLTRGWWYVAALLALLGLLALAATGTGRGARGAAMAAVLVGAGTVVLAMTVGDAVAGRVLPNLAGLGAVDVRTTRGTGAWFGVAAAALLGLAAALVAGRAGRR